ncbi:hypothetical protein DDZ13_05300 [Coraliomargarita sinensis]|uniref:POTRA domain-containing protein n=1 Tax=Coraliomargarita sinensis TaxID=2174842 RepID=A0A317ZHZ1_9BACT|nr:hypothetical protein [Coraliomargarita sinensis]PXA04592.1 hypothetical protein DDZ13_05300 [Coraliomargarita sinensis]
MILRQMLRLFVRRKQLGLLTGLAVSLFLLPACSEEATESHYPYDEELSTVAGVSIVKVESSHAHGYSSNSQKLDAHGIDLLTALCVATEVLDPIILKKDLPQGEFNVVARVKSEGRDELPRRLCRAFSEAFACRVTRRMIEVDATVVSCPDREALSLEWGTENKGIVRNEELPDLLWRTRFSADLDTIIKFANYTSRTLAKSNDLPDRKALLSQVFVNETGIEDIVRLSLVRDSGDPGRIKASLRDLGFTVTEARRRVPAIVVEPEVEGKEWSYLSD